MASQIPSVPYIESRHRISKGFRRVYHIELLELELMLQKGQITQTVYDDSVAAIQRDLLHLKELMASLVEISISDRNGDAG